MGEKRTVPHPDHRRNFMSTEWRKVLQHSRRQERILVCSPIRNKNRFTRLPFGLVACQDVFQKQLHSSLQGFDGVTGIADDSSATEQEHERKMINCS